MAHLDHISVHGFKSIKSLEKLAIKNVNVVVGSNGSGKSNLIGVFDFMHAIREGKLSDYVGTAGGAGNILHFGARVTPELRLKISFDSEANQYGLYLKPTAEDRLFISAEVASFWDKKKYSKPYDDYLQPTSIGEAGISRTDIGNQSRIAAFVRGKLATWRVYHFHDTSRSSPLKRSSELHDNAFLRPDGSNLPSFLYLLSQKHPDAYRTIVKTVNLVAPFFVDFRLAPLQLNQNQIRLQWIHKGTDAYFDASSLSDGTMRFIALATLFLQPQNLRPSVILVDEPELGLHPYAVGVLASLIKSASAHTQVIVSTQAPQLLDHFQPEDILVADRNGEATQFSRLDAKSLGEWLADYSLGQLWEKNEFGGRPRSQPPLAPPADGGSYPTKLPPE